jgi:hypothetical protein
MYTDKEQTWVVTNTVIVTEYNIRNTVFRIL